jgi:hypothetical protein
MRSSSTVTRTGLPLSLNDTGWTMATPLQVLSGAWQGNRPAPPGIDSPETFLSPAGAIVNDGLA